MLIGIVEGNATATIRHPSLKGLKLLIVQPLDMVGGADGDPVLAVDTIGAGRGMKVLLTNDGKGARELVGDKTSPVRWTVCGIVDHE